MRSNLALRVGAALVFVPAFAAAVWGGGWPLWMGTALIVGAGTGELFGLYRQKGIRPFLWPGVVMSVSLSIWSFRPALCRLDVLLVIFVTGTLSTALVQRRDGASLQDVAATLFGVLYVGLLGSALLLVRNLPIPHAAPLALTVLVSTWIMDAVAYFAGRWLGRTRPFVRVSPKKSLEGCLAGLLGAIGVVYLGAFWMENLLWSDILSIGLSVGVGGQVGDFSESLLKRDSGVKDASAIIPGHGGVLDRFDSALFAFPLVYAYLVFRYGVSS